MSKYSTSKKVAAPNRNRSRITVNRAGGQAYTQTAKLEFASILLTSFLKDKFYESEGETVSRITTLLGQVDPKFAAKTAIFARNEYGMRSVSHLVAGEIALRVKGEEWTKSFFDKVVRRPDDILEILAYVLANGDEKVPNSLKKGLGAALTRQTEHSLAKYAKANAALSMVDAVNLLHPKHTEALGKLMKGTLAPADTWETALTQSGEEGSEVTKADAWAGLVRGRKLKYMALIRNIRNIKTHAPEVLDELCKQLVDREAIVKSLMLPFRFLTAFDVVTREALPGAGEVLRALSRAADLAVENVPVLPNTLLAIDNSGSMGGQHGTIAGLFAATVFKRNPDADVMTFHNDATYLALNSDDSILSIAKSLTFPGGATNFHAIFSRARKAYDRIVIFSDMQGWVGYHTPAATFVDYKRRFSANPYVYSVDLAGHGSMMFPQDQGRVCCMAGWSDKIFDTMKMVEEDKNALIHQIEAVDL